MFSEVFESLPGMLRDFAPGAPAEDRAAWEAVPAHLARSVIDDAVAALERPWPQITASAWREYTLSGDRAGFEALYFERRRRLNTLVLAELLEAKGRFTASVVDGIFLVCEESGWQLPAHNAYERGGVRLALPDADRPVIDLFAAETAAQLATISFLLGGVLDAFDPLVRVRIGHEVQRRILSPYLSAHFWWMGRGQERMNNWTAWITQNVLLATFALPTNQDLRRSVVHKALGSLDAFIKDYAEDGACEEGVAYYRHAALCLHGALTVLEAAAPGCFYHLWHVPKIRNMAEYIAHMHVDGHFFFNFADSPAVVPACTVREYLFGRATGSDLLAGFAAANRRGSDAPHLPDEWNLWYRVLELLHDAEIATAPAGPSISSDRFYPGIGLFVARDERFALAVKGGNNGESHNHNDVGTVTLYSHGKPFLIDVGVGTYTARTFSDRRYEIWTMQSAFHNLPDFDGVMQADGAEFAADDMVVLADANGAQVSLELAGAWPPGAHLERYTRTVRMLRNRNIEIIDSFSGGCTAVLSLMVVPEPVVTGARVEILGAGLIDVEGAAGISYEAIDIDDARLRQTWPPRIHRLRIPFASGRLRLCIS